LGYNYRREAKNQIAQLIRIKQKPLLDPFMRLDHSSQNLQGYSFQGRNLAGANFTNADIRGANFTNALLKDANFANAKAGLQERWRIFLVIISLLLSTISALTLTNAINIAATTEVLYKTGIAALTWIGVASVGVAGVLALTLACTLTEIVGVSKALSLVPFIIVAIYTNYTTFSGIASVNAFAVGLGTIGVIFLSTYISLQALTGNQKYEAIRKIAIAFAATGGTSFRNADLTDGDFTGATLKNTDFRKANLTRTRFYEAKKLDFARVGNSILGKRDILNLLVTGNGRGKSYAGANLKGANLIGTDLKEANLKDADISKATFQEARLEWANLTLAQAVGTDFTSAQMTGACIEAWNIDSTTKFDNVDCRFIYLLESPKPGTDERERLPSSGEFQSGEFTKLFEEVLNTVDLIFRDGIDWKAFVAAFQTVQDQNEDTKLALHSIEKKDDGVVVVRVNTLSDLNKARIAGQFTQNYQLAIQAVEEKYQKLLEAKDEEIEIYRQQKDFLTKILDPNAIMPTSEQENKE
jgi:uncharacterized protein YjbI with pentapeptide repeats